MTLWSVEKMYWLQKPASSACASVSAGAEMVCVLACMFACRCCVGVVVILGHLIQPILFWPCQICISFCYPVNSVSSKFSPAYGLAFVQHHHPQQQRQV